MTKSALGLVNRLRTNETAKYLCGLAADEIERLSALAEERDELVEALKGLVEARALRTVLPVVAGWNGPNGEYGRHPPRLGATIRTNCGAMYELADALTAGQAALKSKPQEASDE